MIRNSFFIALSLCIFLLSCTEKAETKKNSESRILLHPSEAPTAITRTIKEDQNGNIWMATFDGIYKLNDGSFSKVDSSVSQARFFSILEDSQGKLWFGSIGEGVFNYDGKNLQNLTMKDGLASNEITSIYEDSQGDIWFGGNGGFSRYNGKTFQNFLLEPGAVVEDTSVKPRIKMESPENMNRSINEVNTILEDRNGTIWIATRGASFTYDGESFSRIEHDGGPFGNVRWIMEDSSGSIWLGGPFGLWRYAEQKFQKISSDFTGYMYEDQEGNIWISSSLSAGQNWAISKIDVQLLSLPQPITEVVTSGERMTFGIEQSSEGTIWYGSIEGAKTIQKPVNFR